MSRRSCKCSWIIIKENPMKEKISVIPYLPFKGDCEEAVNTYISAFGGEILFISRWDENNYDMSPEQIGKVMHVEFTIGGSRMAAGGQL